MGNTFFKPGKSSREDVFDVRDGVYLKGMKGGSVDIFAGGFMFKADEAYEVKNGELGKLYRDTAISGNIMETLKNVEAVGKDFGTSPGFCGKGGQQMPVSDGGPHIRVRNVKIG
jgi:TldD protein